MVIKFTDGPKYQPTPKERQAAKSKAMASVLMQIADGTLKPKSGRKPDPNAKKLLTLRLDPQVIEYFRSTGEGWQTKMNDALRKADGL